MGVTKGVFGSYKNRLSASVKEIRPFKSFLWGLMSPNHCQLVELLFLRFNLVKLTSITFRAYLLGRGVVGHFTKMNSIHSL